jgi:hypothetical protein
MYRHATRARAIAQGAAVLIAVLPRPSSATAIAVTKIAVTRIAARAVAARAAARLGLVATRASDRPRRV